MDDSDVDSSDSDRELQVAFKKGLLQPGLNIQQTVIENPAVDNVSELKDALKDLHNGLPWVERLDLTVDPVPAPKAMSIQLGESPDNLEGEDVHNDFKREMKFHRLAQAAVLEGLSRLKSMGIPTKRPDDYMAEMAKSDLQMKKVRQKLISKTVSLERKEKAKKLRDLRKYGKKVQTEVLQKRQKDKREMMDAVKKYRKGKTDKLDFLDEDRNKNNKGKPQQGKKNMFQANKKRLLKNQKFGFGGQKKRSKYNTAESARDMSDYSAKKHGKQSSKNKKANQPSNNRPGKNRRQKQKSNQKKK